MSDPEEQAPEQLEEEQPEEVMEQEDGKTEEGDNDDIEIVSESEESEFSFEGTIGKKPSRQVPLRSRLKNKTEDAASDDSEPKKKKPKSHKQVKEESNGIGSKEEELETKSKRKDKKSKDKKSRKEKKKKKSKKKKREELGSSDSEENASRKRAKREPSEDSEEQFNREEEERLAILVGFPPHEMIPIEKEFFPSYADGYQHLYLRFRNIIVSKWKKDVSKMVTLEECAEGIQDEYFPQVEATYHFLMRHGFINVGTFSNWELKKFPFRTEAPRVIVIGAGAAGLSCASQLHQFGYRVTVLEARDRLGGRCFSSDKLNMIKDLGAQIITGLVGNPLSVLTEQLNLRTHVITADACLRTERGEIVDQATDIRMEKLFNELLDHASSFRDPSSDQSLGVCMERILPQLRPMEAGILDWYYANLEYACATDLKALSLSHWDQDDPYDFSGDHLILKDGYRSMVAPLAEGIDVKLNTVVKEIKYDGPGVEILTQDGQVFHGNATVVTLPLGVLKTDAVTFSPPLPQYKREAISSLGFGILNKVALRFEEVFWEADYDWVGKVIVNGSRDKRGMNYLWWNYYKVSNEPILVSLCAGQSGYDLEELEDQAIIDYCTKSLQKMYKLPYIPKVVDYEITRWKSEQYTRGSYSYVAVGATGDDYDRLAKTVQHNQRNKIFFGGEHTNRFWPATVAGAYQSGLREAEKVHSNFVTPKRSPFRPPRQASEVDQENEKIRLKMSHQAKPTSKNTHHRGIRSAQTTTEAATAAKERKKELSSRFKTYGFLMPKRERFDSDQSKHDMFRRDFNRQPNDFRQDNNGQRQDYRNQGPDYNRPPQDPNRQGPDHRNQDYNRQQWHDFNRGPQGHDYRGPPQGPNPYAHGSEDPYRQHTPSHSMQQPMYSSSIPPQQQNFGAPNLYAQNMQWPLNQQQQPQWGQPQPVKEPVPPKLVDDIKTEKDHRKEHRSSEYREHHREHRSSEHREHRHSEHRRKKDGHKSKKEGQNPVHKKFKKLVAEVVVNRLNRHRAQGKIPDKEDFKHAAKGFTAKVVKHEIKKKGNFELNETKKLAIKKLVDDYFKTHPIYTKPPKPVTQ